MTVRPESLVASTVDLRPVGRFGFLRTQRAASIGLILPALAYLALMTQAPFVLTLWYSFRQWVLTSPDIPHKWVGFSNYTYELTQDPIFRQAIYNTLEFTAAIVGGSLLLGLAFALLLNRSFPLRGVARSLMIAPFFVMPTVNAVVQKNLFLNPIFGLLNWIMTSVGFARIDWLAVHPKLSIIEMAVWQWAPFMMLILLAGLQGIPDDVREAARIDGAGPFTEFRRITIPLLGPYFQLAVLLGMIYILQLFGEIFVATQGGPGTATTTIPYYIYQTISQANDVGSSSAQGVLAIIFSSIIAALLLRLLLRDVPVGSDRVSAIEVKAPRQSRARAGRLGLNLLTYAVAFLVFFPILWTLLTAFKTEANAAAIPPVIWFHATLDQFRAVLNANYLSYFENSAIIAAGSTLLALVLGLPAAYSLAFNPTKYTPKVLSWVLSTKMLPAVGALIPLIIIYKRVGLFDSRFGMILLYAAFNLPLVIWMMRSFFADLPHEILEAATVDGAGFFRIIGLIVIPLTAPGLAATVLLSMIFSWNEFLLAVNLTGANSGTLPVFISGFMTSEGLFWAKMSAASTMAVAPVILAGWMAQRSLVRGLTFGAVK